MTLSDLYETNKMEYEPAPGFDIGLNRMSVTLQSPFFFKATKTQLFHP